MVRIIGRIHFGSMDARELQAGADREVLMLATVGCSGAPPARFAVCARVAAGRERKSIEPLARRVPGGNVQALQQFVGQSPWAWEPVRRSLAQHLAKQGKESWAWPTVFGNPGESGRLPGRIRGPLGHRSEKCAAGLGALSSSVLDGGCGALPQGGDSRLRALPGPASDPIYRGQPTVLREVAAGLPPGGVARGHLETRHPRVRDTAAWPPAGCNLLTAMFEIARAGSGLAADRRAGGRRSPHPVLVLEFRCGAWCDWPNSAGESSRTTSSLKRNWITTQGAAGKAGITTSLCLAYAFPLPEGQRLKKTPVSIPTSPETRRCLPRVLMRLFGICPTCRRPTGKGS
jgi:hypothetical protein